MNPLGAALRHYDIELRETVELAGATVKQISFLEPSASGTSRLNWLISYLRALRTARAENADSVIVMWPVLGYLDLIIFRLLRMRRTRLIMHDPTPLVRAIGYGRSASALARRLGVPSIITHSERARAEVATRVGHEHVTMLLHPSLSARPTAANQGRDTIRVLGQYKSSRNLSVMRALAADERLRGFTFEVVGRGWPDVDGWNSRNEFVSETELARLISESAAIVIPYDRFYQSGIAIRAMESGVPVVGPRASSLSEIFGHAAANLADDDWGAAVTFAVSLEGDELFAIHDQYMARVAKTASTYYA